MSDDAWTISDGRLSATIKADGSELSSLRDAEGREWLWQAGPAWPRHAPILFPIVGKLRADTLQVGDAAYRLTQHGFARDRRFAWTLRENSECRLLLVDDDATRALFPFAFRLEIIWRITDGVLHQALHVENPAATPLPFSIGLHPAFAWPLPGAAGKGGHAVIFDQPEPAPIRRLDGGGLGGTLPSPIAGNRLDLHEGLFVEDAIILDLVASRRMRFIGPQGQAVTFAWEGFPSLGIWMKPGGDYLCLEPWQGFASPVGWDGEFAEKPGVVTLPGGEARVFTARISVG